MFKLNPLDFQIVKKLTGSAPSGNAGDLPVKSIEYAKLDFDAMSDYISKKTLYEQLIAEEKALKEKELNVKMMYATEWIDPTDKWYYQVQQTENVKDKTRTILVYRKSTRTSTTQEEVGKHTVYLHSDMSADDITDACMQGAKKIVEDFKVVEKDKLNKLAMQQAMQELAIAQQMQQMKAMQNANGYGTGIGGILGGLAGSVPSPISDPMYKPAPNTQQLASINAYYNKEFLSNLKANISFKGSSGSTYNPSGGQSSEVEPDFDEAVSDEQKLVQKMAVMSDCNVVVQQKMSGTWPRKTISRLFCSKCKAAVPCDSEWITRGMYGQPEIIEFCTSHKHGAEVKVAPVGRKFRDV